MKRKRVESKMWRVNNLMRENESKKDKVKKQKYKGKVEKMGS